MLNRKRFKGTALLIREILLRILRKVLPATYRKKELLQGTNLCRINDPIQNGCGV